MKISEEILNELKALSPSLAAVPRINVFTVDNEYFNSILPELNARIAADAFPVSDKSFSVPEGYFEGLSDSILQKIHAEEDSAMEEMEQLSPVIAAIGNRNIFTVPVNQVYRYR
ncbi:MAG: hypothetical protein WKF88_00850 [Ferruginibacter sp.]